MHFGGLKYEISRLIDIQEVVFYEHSEYFSLRDGDSCDGIRILLGHDMTYTHRI